MEVAGYILCMITPDQRLSGDPDAKITNLGVVNHKMRMLYEEDREEMLRLEDFYVSLRQ